MNMDTIFNSCDLVHSHQWRFIYSDTTAAGNNKK